MIFYRRLEPAIKGKVVPLFPLGNYGLSMVYLRLYTVIFYDLEGERDTK